MAASNGALRPRLRSRGRAGTQRLWGVAHEMSLAAGCANVIVLPWSSRWRRTAHGRSEPLVSRRPCTRPQTSLVVNATDQENHHFNGVASVAAGAFGVGELWNWTINH
jgi:hypothetical protein